MPQSGRRRVGHTPALPRAELAGGPHRGFRPVPGRLGGPEDARELAPLAQAHRTHPARRRTAHPAGQFRRDRPGRVDRAACPTSGRRLDESFPVSRGGDVGSRRAAFGRPAAPDAQPVQQRGPRPLGRAQPSGNQFPPEDFVNGFKNQYASENLSPLLEEAYSAAAERLARNAFRNGNGHGLVTCAPSDACRAEFIPRVRTEAASWTRCGRTR
jgi:Protein of unknown function (DUF1587)